MPLRAAAGQPALVGQVAGELRRQRLSLRRTYRGTPKQTSPSWPHEVGYENAVAFSTAFKRTHGHSPTTRRRNESLTAANVRRHYTWEQVDPGVYRG